MILRGALWPIRYAILLIGFGAVSVTLAQPPAGEEREPLSAQAAHRCRPGCWLHHFGAKQLALWQSPLKLKGEDVGELSLLAGITTGLLTTDRPLARISTTESPGMLAAISEGFSHGGSWGGTLAVTGGLYVSAWLREDPEQMKTASLAFEAVLHATVITSAVKGISGRERPRVNDYRGGFGNFGHLHRGTFSFPSGHSGAVWAMASVISERHRSPWVKVLSYSLATAVGVSRITGKNHFYSDVVVGSYLGYKIGKWVVKHDR